MPYRYGRSRATTIWIDEDLLYRVAVIAEELGYRSLSAFVRDLFREVVAAYELSKDIRIEDEVAKRKFVLQSVFTKIRSILSLRRT